MSNLSLTTVGTTGPSTLNTGTGVLNIPNYADISQLGLTTTGGGGAASLASGTLNVPIYASGAMNQVQLTTPSNVTTTYINPTSTGLGLAFQAVYKASVLIAYNGLISNVTGNSVCVVYVYRTTGAIPALGTLVSGDLQVAVDRSYAPATGAFTANGIIYDSTLATGISYNYYLAFSSSGGSNTLTLYSGAILLVTEAK